MSKLIATLIALLASVCLAHAYAPKGDIRATQNFQDGSWYNITVTKQGDDSASVEIIYTDKNGVVLLQATYDDAVDYWDGHMTGLITREGFSLRYDWSFGCYLNCESTSLSRKSPPLLNSFEFPRCGGNC